MMFNPPFPSLQETTRKMHRHENTIGMMIMMIFCSFERYFL